MLNALKKSKGRALGVAFVEKTISDEELIELDKAGVRGIRYSYVKRLTNPPPSGGGGGHGEPAKAL